MPWWPICSAKVASDPDPDRATVVVHVPVEVLWGEELGSGPHRELGAGDGRSHDARDSEPGCALEGGGVVSVAVARRLACDARIETVLTGPGGWVKGLGRSSRDPSPQMLRALRRRDLGCRFPGCGTRAFTKAHHIRWWTRQGSDRHGQPGAAVQLPSQVCARTGVEPDPEVRQHRAVLPSGRTGIPGGTGTAGGRRPLEAGEAAT